MSNELSKRTPRMVGREQEVARLSEYLYAGSQRHFLYYWGHGGLGKTRLLEELQAMVEEAGPDFCFSGIIDLYHTDTHSTSAVERAIVEGLDPKEKYFARYRQERQRFVLLRERGTDPGVLERHRESLSQLFVQGCREMALESRKLVICFDTVELLQYESSIVEETAGLDTVDTRLKPWLLSKLPQLANVLIVFAGRPKLPAPDETVDRQARLVKDLQRAFGQGGWHAEFIELTALTLEETQAFIQVLADEAETIPSRYLPVVHRLTGGRPIFLHLLVDLLQVLAPESRSMLEMFDQYADLVGAPEGDKRLEEARGQIQTSILNSVFNKAGEIGGYLSRLALMPKGVDVEILQQGLGLPAQEAEHLTAELTPLSFVKSFKALPGAERLHYGRIFLHDEMYHLLTSKVIRNLRINERQVAHALVTNYYAPHIAKLEQQLQDLAPDERIPVRERLQKFQVERLYYLLVCDPCQGYAEYKRLSDQANRRRWVGFSMRLLDEFLRFHNLPERRAQFEAACIPPQQVIRESAMMWVERFHWWGQYDREIQFARQVMDQPERFSIRPAEDLAILANICALWARAYTVLHGYKPEIVAEAQATLNRLPPLSQCSADAALARARLSNSIGYQLRQGGELAQAATHYADSQAAFRKLEQYPDELAMLMNNLSFVYAKQGKMALARVVGREAVRISEAIKDDYSTGLALSTQSNIACIRGSYAQAAEYGQEALALFRELEDPHGTTLAYLGIAQARRRLAKHELEKGRRVDEARYLLQEALENLESALTIARENDLQSRARELLAEQGRVHRERGHLIRRQENYAKALPEYRQGENCLRQALSMAGWATVDRADALQDLAEILFVAGDELSARQYLSEIEELIGVAHRIVPGEHVPEAGLAPEYFAPLGKAEMQRAQMALTQGRLQEGLEHYMAAYAYLERFSPDAEEKDTMLQYLYNNLRDRPVDELRSLFKDVRTWLQQNDLGVDLTPFLETLESLLGV